MFPFYPPVNAQSYEERKIPLPTSGKSRNQPVPIFFRRGGRGGISIVYMFPSGGKLHLLLVLLLLAVATLGSLGLLSADTAGTATAEGRGEGKVDVLLGVKSDDERGHVDDLLADTDVALADEDTGVVDGLGETKLVHAGLETTLEEILNLEGQDVIQLHARLVEDTDTHQTANEGIAFKETLGVLLVEGQELTVWQFG